MLWECWLGLYDILPKFLYFMHSLSCDIKKMFCSDSSKTCSLMILKITALKAVIPGGTDGFWPQVNTSCFSYVWLLRPCFQWPAGLLWLWDFPRKNPGGGCHAFLWGSSRPRDGTCISRISLISCTAGGFLTSEPPGKTADCTLVFKKL